MRRVLRHPVTIWLSLGVLMLAVMGFAVPSAQRGVAAFLGDTVARGRLTGGLAAEFGIYLHMMAGAIITCLAVVQWAGPLRRHAPRLHRASGRLLAPLALITATGGLVYIMVEGTIGGALMDVGFGLYGGLMVIAALQTRRFAIARDLTRHRAWGLRLIVLCLGSWLYRVHYGLWFAGTCSIGPDLCGAGVQPDFRGLFDQITIFAFYLPYLGLVEWHLRRGRPTRSAPLEKPAQ
ncbi:MAG: DUF2306 domain-containing protein [Pseudomonadota bacterium]